MNIDSDVAISRLSLIKTGAALAQTTLLPTGPAQLTRYREWQDTVMTRPRETIEVAFVADNPGDRMFPCHIAEHLASGMTGIVRVA